MECRVLFICFWWDQESVHRSSLLSHSISPPPKMLYNIWHGFSVSSLWPRELWQAVTLWLVNRAMTVVGVVRSNRCVTRRRPRDNHAVRFRQRAENRESSQGHAADQRVRSSLTIRLARGCKSCFPWLPEEYGTRRSPLSEYMSLHLSLKLTTNSEPLFQN